MNGYREQANGEDVPNHEILPRIKCVVLGDGACGKTSLLTVYTEGEFPELYTPTVFENYTAEIEVGQQRAILMLWDTAGQEDYDRLRPLSYDNADVILLCYDIASQASFYNIEIRWAPEVKHFCQGVPKLLVACKTDLRPNEDDTSSLRSGNSATPADSATEITSSFDATQSNLPNMETTPTVAINDKALITTAMGKAMAEKINASAFIECSAKCNVNVGELFKVATEQVLPSDTPVERDSRCCIVS